LNQDISTNSEVDLEALLQNPVDSGFQVGKNVQAMRRDYGEKIRIPCSLIGRSKLLDSRDRFWRKMESIRLKQG